MSTAVEPDDPVPTLGQPKALFPWLESKPGLVCAPLLLLLLNFALRSQLEEAGSHLYSHAEAAWPQATLESVRAMPWWRFLLPIPEFSGTWTTTSNMLVWNLETWLAPAAIYYLGNALFVGVTYGLAYHSTRSGLFAFTLGLCAAFTTHNYQVYAVTGTIALYLVMVYAEVVFFCLYRLWGAEEGRVTRWAILSALALVPFVLSYEGWLDFASYCWLAAPVLYGYHRRRGEAQRARRVLITWIGISALAVIYVAVKVNCGFGQVKGSESDLVFNSPWPRLAVEDALTHVVTFFYTSISTFIPGPLAGSEALGQVGAEALVADQHGYHSQANHLIPMNYHFSWRFLAGGALALWLGMILRTTRKLWTRPEPRTLAVLLVLILVLVGSPTHALVKMRPMHTVPFLGYQVWLSVLGLFALVGLVVRRLEQAGISRGWARILVALIWLDVVSCAFTRPPVLSEMAKSMGVGWSYPDPWERLCELSDLPWRRWVTTVVVWVKSLLG
ncbi:MAG: hypothetical protein JKY65_01900 [Planctomycetes bacterium]|nr:hypothetical protein [Planctomycetota bacterium]